MLTTQDNTAVLRKEGTNAVLKGRKPGYFEVLVNFHAPGSGSGFPLRSRNQDSQINADPWGSGSKTMEIAVKVESADRQRINTKYFHRSIF